MDLAEELLELLLAKGIVTQKEYDDIKERQWEERMGEDL